MDNQSELKKNYVTQKKNSSNFIVLSSVISFNKLIDEIFLHHSLQDFALLLKLLELGLHGLSMSQPWHNDQLQETSSRSQTPGKPCCLSDVEVKLDLIYNSGWELLEQIC